MARKKYPTPAFGRKSGHKPQLSPRKSKAYTPLIRKSGAIGRGRTRKLAANAGCLVSIFILMSVIWAIILLLGFVADFV